MYPPHHLGGYELMWHSAVARMRDAGHELRVLTSDYRADTVDPDVLEGPDVHRELAWYWHDHGFPRIGLRARLALERANAAVLGRHLSDHRPDAVNWWAMGGMSLSLIELVRQAGLPAAGAVVDDWMWYGPRVDAWQRVAARAGPLRGVLGRLAGVPGRVDLGAAGEWVFVSETTRRHAVEQAGWRLPRTRVAHAGIDREAFPAAPASEWGGRLLCVGRIDPRKGVATAILALAELPEMRLDVIGPGDPAHRAELEQLVTTHGLAGRVSFRRVSRTRLPLEYAMADAVLFPVQWEEPWGLVPLEAMAVGRPVVATGAGGSGEYLRDGENSLIYSPAGDPASLAAAIGRLASSPGLRDSLRTGGFATVESLPMNLFDDAVIAALEEALR